MVFYSALTLWLGLGLAFLAGEYYTLPYQKFKSKIYLNYLTIFLLKLRTFNETLLKYLFFRPRVSVHKM